MYSTMVSLLIDCPVQEEGACLAHASVRVSAQGIALRLITFFAISLGRFLPLETQWFIFSRLWVKAILHMDRTARNGGSSTGGRGSSSHRKDGRRSSQSKRWDE